MTLYLFERVADNGLNMLVSFGSKKCGRVASAEEENKGSDDVRIVFEAVVSQLCGSKHCSRKTGRMSMSSRLASWWVATRALDWK